MATGLCGAGMCFRVSAARIHSSNSWMGGVGFEGSPPWAGLRGSGRSGSPPYQQRQHHYCPVSPFAWLVAAGVRCSNRLSN